MKTFNRTSLPDEIKYNGKTYIYNAAMTGIMQANQTSPRIIQAVLKEQGRSAVLVKVLSRNLKGKSGLFGGEYKPQPHLFTTSINESNLLTK